MHWQPFPGSQMEFCGRGEYEVLYGGAAGPGKTDCLVALASRGVGRPSYKGLLLRRTFPQLQEIMDRCWDIYPRFGGVFRSGKTTWMFPSGAMIRLGHMQHEDDKRRYHGAEYQFVGFDELTEFSLGQYMYIFSRMRSARDSGLRPIIRSTTNPGGPGHVWVKERFIDPVDPLRTHIDLRTGLSRAFVPGRVTDNVALMENDPGYVTRLEALPEIERKRYLDGDWEIFEGQAFPELSTAVHGCDPFDIPLEWERFMVLDWGYANPFSVGWYAVDYEGILYRYREWYGVREGQDGPTKDGAHMLAEDVAAGILERERDAGEKIRVRIADASVFHMLPAFRAKEARGPTIADDFHARGVFLLKSDRDRLQGKQQVHKRLALDYDMDEATGEILNQRPRVQVFRDHIHFWRTMFDMQLSTKNPDDVDTDQEDHAYDEFRYACMHRPIRPKRVVTAPPGSFKAERDRLIRARKYARSHGVSLQAAYSRIR